MRKSSAPSLRQFKSFLPTSTSNKVQIQKIARNDKNSLKIFENNTNSMSDTNTILCTKENQNNFDDDMIIFNVVWSKITTKKYKTWEGDGILEVKHKTAVLKDSNGTILSTEKGIKKENLYDGSRLIIGSKEIEIQEQISNSKQNNQNCNQDFDLEPEIKKKKLQNTLITSNVESGNNSLSSLKSIGISKISMKTICDSLIFPAPSCSHQWKFNEKKNPVREVKVSNHLFKYLRPHQKEGIIFLYECLLGYKDENNFGAILADEMGLGKTLQCLTVCHTLLKQGPYGEPVLKRILIVTPSSLIETWNKEIMKWLQSERMFAYVVNSKNKIKDYKKQIYVPFVIASYETVLNNCIEFKEIDFDLLICDEGHRLKNSNIKISVALRELEIKRRIILSGTPVQNDLQEFYMLVDFVNPGILGSYNEYKQNYENPIVQSQATNATEEIINIGREKSEELNQIIGRFMLRRTQNVNNEYLPKKREIIVFVKPSELQKLLITKVLEWYESRHEIFEKDLSPLQIISILKKICNHPSLLQTIKQESQLCCLKKLISNNYASDMNPSDSGKLKLVQCLLQERIIRMQEKVVLVSNHTKTLSMLAKVCNYLKIKYLQLDGSTQVMHRNLYVEKFNRKNSEYQVFLLSAKAGGCGLNLCGASNLILYDNDWNPATDLQAMSRIWRDGQKNDVKIYRLITAWTIEEKIFQRQIMKTSLSDCVINHQNKNNIMDIGSSNTVKIQFSDDELKNLFSINDNFADNDNCCSTHEWLECNCKGDGTIITEEQEESIYEQQDEEEDDPFGICFTAINTIKKEVKSNEEKNINELKYWEHYKSPINSKFLQEIGLLNATENILFIFSNETKFEKNTKNDEFRQLENSYLENLEIDL